MMKSKVLIILFFLLINVPLVAQSKGGKAAQTNGPNSPAILGAKGKVEYVTEQVINQKIPNSLAPYLAGLLFTNKQIGSDKNSINSALSVWFRKYRSLEVQIKKVNNVNTRNLAMMQLNEGNFTAVETILNTKTSSDDLVKKFPKTYVTNGANSPIIIGDFGTITYVVKEVINYKLPEGLTTNLLNELKSKDKLIGDQNGKLGDLTNRIEIMNATVKNYVERYNTIKEQLKKSPSKIYQTAYKYFKDGNLDKAMEVLDSGASNDKALGEAKILKAKILLLQLSTSKMDKTLQDINSNYSIGVSLAPSAEQYYEYGKFLLEYLAAYTAAIPILEKADVLETDNLKKVYIYTYLGIAYTAVDRIKTSQLHEKALRILDGMEPLQDKELIQLKAQLYFNMGAGYAFRTFSVATIQQSIGYSKSAIDQLEKINPKDELIKYKIAQYYSQQGQQYAFIADTINAKKSYNSALDFLEKAYNQNPDFYAISLASIYFNIAELNFNFGNSALAVPILIKAIDIIEPRLSGQGRIYYQTYEQLYTALLKNYVYLNKTDEIILGLHHIKRELKPFIEADSKTYLLNQAWCDTDLGDVYLSIKQLDSARKYTEPAYKYYLNNINALQFDKQKASKCIFGMNELWSQSGEYQTAISNNYALQKKIKESFIINRFGYEDFLPQMEKQFAKTFTLMKVKDSAYAHMKLAMDLIEPKSKQYGSSYLILYGDYMVNEFLMKVGFHDYQLADQVEKRFLSNCEIIMNVDEFVKNYMQSMIGECISNFAVQTFHYSQNHQELSNVDVNTLFKMASSYFDDSAKYFQVGMDKNKPYGAKYAISLSQAIYLETFWVKYLQEPEMEQHHLRKCNLSKQAIGILNDQPVNLHTNGIKQQILAMVTDCR